MLCITDVRPCLPISYPTVRRVLQESGMNKLFGIAIVVYLLGDPELSLVDGINIAKEYIAAIALALVTIPWVTSQFDN